jgi:hypothetical protein
MLDQIEGMDRGIGAPRRLNPSNRDKPFGPTASPSIVKLLALIPSTAAAMADSRASAV